MKPEIAHSIKQRLTAFEDRVAEAFRQGRIHAPVHLCSDSQAEHLIRIFEDVQPNDYVFATWRNHMHCLLKGVPEEELFQAILDGRSMTYCNKQHRILCSSIVGGILPIAAGVAWAIKQRGGTENVWVFVGDMAARSGLYREFSQLCRGHALPVRVVIENNGYSTDTPTDAAWGNESLCVDWQKYDYERTWPHVGVGEHVTFF